MNQDDSWASEQIGINHVEAETDPDNKASQRVLEKADENMQR